MLEASQERSKHTEMVCTLSDSTPVSGVTDHSVPVDTGIVRIQQNVGGTGAGDGSGVGDGSGSADPGAGDGPGVGHGTGPGSGGSQGNDGRLGSRRDDLEATMIDPVSSKVNEQLSQSMQVMGQFMDNFFTKVAGCIP